MENRPIPIVGKYLFIREGMSVETIEELEKFINQKMDEEGYIGQWESELILIKCKRILTESQNVGKFVNRIETNDREKYFHLNWQKVNKMGSGINNGHDLLQCLFANAEEPINSHNRMIAATVIQWLGSNVGMSFLDDTLKMMGKRIVDIEK